MVCDICDLKWKIYLVPFKTARAAFSALAPGVERLLRRVSSCGRLKWCLRTCTPRLPRCLALYGQYGHSWAGFLSPHSSFSWRRNVDFQRYFLPQWRHANSSSPLSSSFVDSDTLLWCKCAVVVVVVIADAAGFTVSANEKSKFSSVDATMIEYFSAVVASFDRTISVW